MKYFKSNGKLLLTGEYLVLDGAKALALPTKFGQDLLIEDNQNDEIHWESYDQTKRIWFKDCFNVKDILRGDFKSENDISKRLIQILKSIHVLNPDFLKSDKGYSIKTSQDFNRSWGLGTSSTLINNMATWADVDAYKLLELTFGGSGYDIACAQHNSPITYQITDNKPKVTPVSFSPSFKDCIYFVYLNQKQNSREGIANYRKFKGDLSTVILDINRITDSFILCDALSDFETLIQKHEHIISGIIHQNPVKERLFHDFNGEIKSLGAWGGDFVMVTSKENPEAYFKTKGFDTILKYSEMIKQ